MARIRRASLHPLGQLRAEMDRLFEDFLGGGARSVEPAPGVRPSPAFNLWEEGDNLFVESELPGVRPEDLDISVVGDQLTLRGQRPAPGGDVAYHRQERWAGQFARQLSLPCQIDAEAVEATLRDGVLMLKLPKAPAHRPRKIAVSD